MDQQFGTQRLTPDQFLDQQFAGRTGAPTVAGIPAPAATTTTTVTSTAPSVQADDIPVSTTETLPPLDEPVTVSGQPDIMADLANQPAGIAARQRGGLRQRMLGGPGRMGATAGSMAGGLVGGPVGSAIGGLGGFGIGKLVQAIRGGNTGQQSPVGFNLFGGPSTPLSQAVPAGNLPMNQVSGSGSNYRDIQGTGGNVTRVYDGPYSERNEIAASGPGIAGAIADAFGWGR